MCNTTLEEKTVEIISQMFSWKTFDITLLESYFLENEVKIDLVFSLYHYLYKNEWANTFIFTDIFSIEFKKIIDIFICLHSHLFISYSNKVKIDEMNLQNPILFTDEFVQYIFKMWLKWEC